ncbi:RPL15 [Scenedesmus sp. PABB004]|nr:RPL15 [Scenedesmus sp. PABB004]
MQVAGRQQAFLGARLGAAAPVRALQPVRAARVSVAAAEGERLRLHNLSPQKGSRRDEKRKGRGYGGHQGGTCGFGNRGQKARSGPSVRPGFEGGQTPLYRRLPKLRGIAGGMSAGLPKFVVVNLSDLEGAFEAGETVNIASIKAKNILNISGRDTKLPLKVLGEGELTKALTIEAASFSSSAAEKISAAGATAAAVPLRKKWTRRAHERRVAEMVSKGLDYKKEAAKAKAARAAAKAKAAATAAN